MCLVLLLASVGAPAQTESRSPVFEVASVKPAEPPAPGRRPAQLTGGPGTKSPTRLTGTATMKSLLIRAFGVKDYQITGPAWLDTERYEIVANVPADSTKAQFELMLQNLLMERFQLAVHRETRELPIYELLLAKSGPKLKESGPAAAAEDAKASADGSFARPRVTMGTDGFPQIPPDAKIPGSFVLSLSSDEFMRIKVFARHQTMDQLADTITGYVSHPVRNLTELQGQYDFTLAFESERRATSGTAARPAGAPTEPLSPASEPGPTIFDAVQSQLGLRLEQKRGPVEMLIVDRLEKVPTEN
jgi:uncharacterized protein (TIGR03435 family)